MLAELPNIYPGLCMVARGIVVSGHVAHVTRHRSPFN